MKKISLLFLMLVLILASGDFVMAQNVGQNEGLAQKNGPSDQAQMGINRLERPAQGQGLGQANMRGLARPAQQNQAMNDVKLPKRESELQQIDKTMPENPNMFMAASSTGKQEKISSPKDLNMFDKIKKIGSALFGVRKNLQPKPIFIKAENAQCVKDAVTKRAGLMKTAITEHNQLILSSLESRVACEIGALDKTSANEQAAANKLCIESDQKNRDNNESAFEKSRQAAQKAFQLDAKQCLGMPRLENPSNTDQAAVK
ncbi:MAG: hypothetical protein WCG01_03935 [bacterium]